MMDSPTVAYKHGTREQSISNISVGCPHRSSSSDSTGTRLELNRNNSDSSDVSRPKSSSLNPRTKQLKTWRVPSSPSLHGPFQTDGTNNQQEDTPQPPLSKFEEFMFHAKSDLRSIYFTLIHNPKFLHIGLFTFLILCAGCITLLFVWAASYRKQRELEAETHAKELASFFRNELNQAWSPMFALRSFIGVTPSLLSLSDMAKTLPKMSDTFADVSSIPQGVKEEFETIVENIMEFSSGLSNKVLTLQLAPYGILTLISPLAGSESALGLNLFEHPERSVDAWRSASTSSMSVIGPINLIEGSFTLIGRIPVFVDPALASGLNTTTEISHVGREVVEGQVLWGFVECIFNFEELLDLMSVEGPQKLQDLTNFDLVYNLTSTRAKEVDNETIEYETAVLSVTPGVPEITDGVTVKVDLPNNEWDLRVSYYSGFRPASLNVFIALVVIGSFFLSVMLVLLLVTRRMHEELLYRMLPERVIKRLQKGHEVVEVVDEATIFFSDIVGFTTMATKMSPLNVMRMLNSLYVDFDELVEKHGVYKVDVIGDAYMVVGGAPERSTGPQDAAKVTKFALDALELVKSKQNDIQIRCGIASGPLVAGVVGRRMPRYDFFGDTVNTASRMESTSEAGNLQISDVTKMLLDNSGIDFVIEKRECVTDGQNGIAIKGKGVMQTYWVRGILDGSMALTINNITVAQSLQGRGVVAGVDLPYADPKLPDPKPVAPIVTEPEPEGDGHIEDASLAVAPEALELSLSPRLNTPRVAQFSDRNNPHIKYGPFGPSARSLQIVSTTPRLQIVPRPP